MPQVTASLDDVTLNRLRELAARDGRSVSELVRAAVLALLSPELPPGVRMTDEGLRYSADWLSP